VSPIVVVDYDLGWPRSFESLKSVLWPAVADVAISIQHVGSTSVRGLAAKPVIDIDVIVPEAQVVTGIARLGSLGYEHQGDLGVSQREAFRSPTGFPRHHLYLCPSTSPALANHLAIRDYLRGHPSDARAYGDLKKQLAIDFADDIDGYVAAKTSFLVGILHTVGFPPEALADIDRTNRRR